MGGTARASKARTVAVFPGLPEYVRQHGRATKGEIFGSPEPAEYSQRTGGLASCIGLGLRSFHDPSFARPSEKPGRHHSASCKAGGALARRVLAQELALSWASAGNDFPAPVRVVLDTAPEYVVASLVDGLFERESISALQAGTARPT